MMEGIPNSFTKLRFYSGYYLIVGICSLHLCSLF